MNREGRTDLLVQSNQRRTPQIIGVVLAMTLVLPTLGGCSMFKGEKDQKKSDILKTVEERSNKLQNATDKKKSTKEDVRYDGGLLLGDTGNLAFTTSSLADILIEQINDEKWNSLDNLVEMYPDIVAKLILESNGKQIGRPQLKAIAQFFDSKLESGQVWHDFVEDLASHHSELMAKRSEFLKRLGNNQPTEALKLKIVNSTSRDLSPLAHAEANRLEGIAHLMLENDAKSIEHFETAFNLSRNSNPYFASKIGLLLGEAQRHAKMLDEWKVTWHKSITLQSSWLGTDSLLDPEFWKKAAFLRPVSEKWPEPVIEKMQSLLAKRGLKFMDQSDAGQESVVWALIGTHSLLRHESQNAILAFKKSESVVSNRNLKNELQMQQALAMITGGQNGPASAILLRLGSVQGGSKNFISDRSKAILATMKLQNGSVVQGMNLLQAAIKSAHYWPESERMRAHADFGLALLMRGREEQGIHLLNQVFNEFAALGNYEHASQCLWNLAKYYQAKENEAEYQTYLARLQKFDRSL